MALPLSSIIVIDYYCDQLHGNRIVNREHLTSFDKCNYKIVNKKNKLASNGGKLLCMKTYKALHIKQLFFRNNDVSDMSVSTLTNGYRNHPSFHSKTNVDVFKRI